MTLEICAIKLSFGLFKIDLEQNDVCTNRIFHLKFLKKLFHILREQKLDNN